MIYPYLCPADGSWDVEKHHSESDKPEACPVCGVQQANQDYQAKRVLGHVDTDNSWSGGRQIFQLHPAHPDYTVGSRKEMEKAYKSNGINMDTGLFRTTADQVRGTLPRVRRTGKIAKVHGSVDEPT